MSGHSKWATTHRQKAVVDAKRGAIFTKLGNQIAIAARGGTDPALNSSLAMAIEKVSEAMDLSDASWNPLERNSRRAAATMASRVFATPRPPPPMPTIRSSAPPMRHRSRNQPCWQSTMPLVPRRLRGTNGMGSTGQTSRG